MSEALPATYLRAGNANTIAARRDRSENDWYVEPAWAVEALLAVEKFPGFSLDPACGEGTIPKVFATRDLDCWATDLVPRGFGGADDFLAPTFLWSVDNIVTNPPFKLAEEFTRQALRFAKHKVAILQRLSWLESRSRAELFDSTPLARVWIFRRRVSMPPGGRGIIAKGGAIAFAWYIWDHGHRGPPTIGWLP